MTEYMVKCRTYLVVKADSEAKAIVKYQKALKKGGFAFTAVKIEVESSND